MLIYIGLYMFNVVSLDWQYAELPRQLAMQSCALCLYVRCGSSNESKKQKQKQTGYVTFNPIHTGGGGGGGGGSPPSHFFLYNF